MNTSVVRKTYGVRTQEERTRDAASAAHRIFTENWTGTGFGFNCYRGTQMKTLKMLPVVGDKEFKLSILKAVSEALTEYPVEVSMENPSKEFPMIIVRAKEQKEK